MRRTAPLLLLLLLISACGEEPAPPKAKVPVAPKPLSIVSTTPLIHGLVQRMVGNVATAHGLLRTPGELAHGDLAADAAMHLRRADVVFMHSAEPFAHVVQTVEAHAPKDRIVSLGGAGAAAVSIAPSAVVQMISAIEAQLCRTDPTNTAFYQQRGNDLRSTTMEFAKSMTSQIDSLPVRKRTILTNDAQVAAVIRGLNLTTVVIDLPLTTHPTQADREALLAEIRQSNAGALAIDAKGSETIREMLADMAKETGVKIITPSLSPWPADGEDYVTWMSRNLEAVMSGPR